MTPRATGLILVYAALQGAALAIGQEPPPASGIDLASLDRSVRPQDDLYRFANGGWLARTTIPPERVTYSAATELVERVDADLRGIIEELASTPQRAGSPAQLIADFYTSLVNRDHVARLGLAPIRPGLQRILAIDSSSAFAAEAGRLTSIGTASAFGTTLSVDPADPREPMVQLTQGGIMLPAPLYYLSDATPYAEVRARYRSYLERIFTLAGCDDPGADAGRVMAVETALARAHLPRVDAQQTTASYERMSLAELGRRMPGFDWRAWAQPQGIHRLAGVIVVHPAFFERFAALVAETPLESWRAWLAARYLTALAPFVSDDLGDARFDFFGRVLSGQEEPREFWRRGVSLVNTHLGDAMGRLYVGRHFPPSSKARVDRIVDHLIAAYREAFAGNLWMSARARSEAGKKLGNLSTKIGYPAQWRGYDGLVIKPDDLLGNIERAKKFESDFRLRWIGRPVSPGGWLMPPQTVNAYYSPGMNEVVFPAALLQPPFFQAGADDAINYGAIGAVIGHEISHAFLDRGREFDANGRLRDWWTPDDDRAYQTLAETLVRQYDASEIAGVRVNGRLTVGETLGDLAGLAIAHRAYRLSLGARQSPILDGFTGDQRFFIGWAQIWRSIDRPEFLRQFVLSNPHPPGPIRANGPVGHLEAFHTAFQVQPGDRLYRATSSRVVIW